MQYPIIDLIADSYLNNGWTGLDISTGKNLVDPNNIIIGFFSSESLEINNNYRTTNNNVEVKPNVDYISSLFDKHFNRINSLVWTEWDINKQYIRQVTKPVLHTTANTKYIAVRNFGNDTPYINNNNYLYQVEEGTQPTPYEPYSEPKNDFPNRLKLPLPHYFPHPVIDALQRAAAGTQTADDTEILRHYLTPLGIGGI